MRGFRPPGRESSLYATPLRLCGILFVLGLGFFITFQFVGESRKFARGGLYLLGLLPVLLCLPMWIRSARGVEHRTILRPLAWLALCLLAVSASHGALFFVDTLEALITIGLLAVGLSISLRHARDWLDGALISTALVLCGLGVWAFLEWFGVAMSKGYFARVQLSGAASNPVHAAFLILFASAYLWFFHVEPRLQRNAPSWLRNLAWLAFALVVSMIPMVFGARSALLSVTALLVLGWWWRERGVWLPVFVVLAVGLGAVFGFERIILERGDSLRLEIWSNVVSHLWSSCNVWVGCGLSGKEIFPDAYRHPHSAYLSMLFFYGLPGLGVLLALLLLATRRAWDSARAWLILAGMGWVSVMATSGGVIGTPRPLWIYFWLPTLLAMLSVAEQGADRDERAAGE